MATGSGAFCDVLAAPAATSAPELDVVAALDVLATACGWDPDAFEVFEKLLVVFAEADVFVFTAKVDAAGRLMVVTGIPSSRFLMVGSALQGWSRSCWQQKELFVLDRVMPRPRSGRRLVNKALPG